MGSSLFGMQAKTAQEMAYIAMDFISRNILNIIGSLIILAVGWIIAKFLGKVLQIFLHSRKADVTITKFLADIVKFLVMATALLIVLGNFGITIAPFIAGLGALGFGASFALQGPLSNYAAGATLIFTKPFKVGDIVEVGEHVGEIIDMTLARTIMVTLDGTRIIIPNKKIIGEIMHNYSEYKKLDMKFGIAYSSDVDKALRIVKEAIAADDRVAAKPVTKIGISDFEDSNIIIYARLWCKQLDYWDLMFDINRSIYKLLDKGGINMSYPRRDVHMITKEK